MILSAQFWPPFKEETLELPQKIKDHLNVYTKAFETLKVLNNFIFKDVVAIVVSTLNINLC